MRYICAKTYSGYMVYNDNLEEVIELPISFHSEGFYSPNPISVDKYIYFFSNGKTGTVLDMEDFTTKAGVVLNQNAGELLNAGDYLYIRGVNEILQCDLDFHYVNHKNITQGQGGMGQYKNFPPCWVTPEETVGITTDKQYIYAMIKGEGYYYQQHSAWFYKILKLDKDLTIVSSSNWDNDFYKPWLLGMNNGLFNEHAGEVGITMILNKTSFTPITSRCLPGSTHPGNCGALLHGCTDGDYIYSGIRFRMNGSYRYSFVKVSSGLQIVAENSSLFIAPKRPALLEGIDPFSRYGTVAQKGDYVYVLAEIPHETIVGSYQKFLYKLDKNLNIKKQIMADYDELKLQGYLCAVEFSTIQTLDSEIDLKKDSIRLHGSIYEDS